VRFFLKNSLIARQTSSCEPRRLVPTGRPPERISANTSESCVSRAGNVARPPVST